MITNHVRKLIIIDPQNDFCSSGFNQLYVPGAVDDIIRISKFIKDNVNYFDEIWVTLDNHPVHHFSHPYFWRDKKGGNPKPFEQIDIKYPTNKMKYEPREPSDYIGCSQYLKYLHDTNQNLSIWPEHCITGTIGAAIPDRLNFELRAWQIMHKKSVKYLLKGTNPYFEQYSAFRVFDGSMNAIKVREFLEREQCSLDMFDHITAEYVICGEALTHCVKETALDVAKGIRNVSNTPWAMITLLTDCTSPVPGCEKMMKGFDKEIELYCELWKTTSTKWHPAESITIPSYLLR